MDTSYLTQQVATIINQLHGYFDEIGVASHERDTRESELFSALSETLHNQLKLVASEKHELTEEARKLIKQIRQMEASLDDSKVRDDYEADGEDMKVTYPLLDCIQHLKSKHQMIHKLHKERYEQVKKLVEALQSYASHLEPSFLSVKLPPTSPNARLATTFDLSPTYVTSLDHEFTRVYEEYNKRIHTVQSLAEEMIMLWGELGTPQAQVDSQIVKCGRDSPEQLGLHQDDLTRMTAKRDKLVEEKRGRERKIIELRTTVESLWERLSVENHERKAFLAANRGCGMRTINEFEDELSRLEEMKRQNLHLFVEDARFKLQELWDGLYFSEEEMLEFTPAFSDVYSDALLSAHEAEIARLEALKEQRAPTLAMVDKHRSLLKDRNDLAASSQDASRLMMKGQKGEKRDPTRLLREEKMRKRIAKDLPKVEVDLRRVLESWEDEYGRPFLVHGERYLDELDAATAPRTAAPSRSKTPSGLAPSSSVRSIKTAPPASRNGTLRGPPPARSKTPTANHARNPLSSSVMAPPSAASSVMGASVSAHGGSVRSPSKIPGRAPLGNMPNGNNSPERRPRPAIVGHGREDVGKTIRGQMGPPARVPPPKMKDFFAQGPPTPSAKYAPDHDLERSASIVRQTQPEDVYLEETPKQSYTPFSGTSSISRPGSVLQYSHRPQNAYPSAPPPPVSRQISNTSVATLQSVVSGSENWETYTENSDPEDADPRGETYARNRTAKRSTPDGGYDDVVQSDIAKKMRAYGLGIHGVKGAGAIGLKAAGAMYSHHAATGREGSEEGWTDDGSVF